LYTCPCCRQSILEDWTVKPRQKNWKGANDPAPDISPADVAAAEAAAAEAAAATADSEGGGDENEDWQQVE